MDKYQIVKSEPYQEWTLGETESEEEAIRVARAEAERTGSAEDIEIRTDFERDNYGDVFAWNPVPFLWQFEIKPYRSNAEVHITRRADAGESICHSIDLSGCRDFSSDELIEGWREEIETVLFRVEIDLIKPEKKALEKALSDLYNTVELMFNM